MGDTGVDIDAVARAAEAGCIDGHTVLDVIEEVRACRVQLKECREREKFDEDYNRARFKAGQKERARHEQD